ncbi:MAG TPA: cytochrome c [Opitutaceae bacterium]|nr:cytochrome c [Opitutaceae bacterium]
MRNVYLATLFVCVLLVSVLGFRGAIFTAPPLDVFPEWAFPGMKYQPKVRPQAASQFFADGRADRLPPPNTVRADLPVRADDARYLGKNARGEFIRGFPAGVAVDRPLLETGRARYATYCAPCHGAAGDGNGITKQYGMGATPTYHDPRLRQIPEGDIYNTITNGKNNMLPYADKLSPEDRWAVVAYVRALQRAQLGTVADVPAGEKSQLGIQ